MQSKPNIIFVFTDQQSASMMSCAGNQYVNTPAMDSLAAKGVRFERAYCTNPVCLPSRFSLMTGRMPSALNIRSNEDGHIEKKPEDITKNGFGWFFRNAGYDVAYGGKEHLPEMRAADLGFDYITSDERDGLADVCAEYIRQKRDRPFLLVASFINPHDICLKAIGDFEETEEEKWIMSHLLVDKATLDKALQYPEGITEKEFFGKYCPPLPSNFEVQQDEPEAISILQDRRPFKKKARARYTPEQWRLHRWAYCKLTEMVDAQIGRIFDAVKKSHIEEDTLIIFSSDHGDMDAAHRMEHKEVLYEEAARIPLIIAQAGRTPAGKVDRTHLISNGLDLIPTLCDYAGIKIPEELAGLSFRRLAEGKSDVPWRKFVPVESEFGRMIVTERYKYMLYDAGKNREQLIDLELDPGEMKNSALDPAYREILEKHRAMFRNYYKL